MELIETRNRKLYFDSLKYYTYIIFDKCFNAIVCYYFMSHLNVI